MPRKSEGLTKTLYARVQPDEEQMARDIAAHMGMSGNRAMRWVLRYAWQHATSTDDHSTCPPNSPCATSTRALAPGRKRPPAAAPDQMTITHSATVEEP